jgi:Arc/MetJ-type ribon-helix-helix transcriptional regulator
MEGRAMAVKDKATYTVELDKHMMAFLEEMVQQYQLPDTSKAMRILITYAMDPETERDRIFEDVRCFDCE